MIADRLKLFASLLIVSLPLLTGCNDSASSATSPTPPASTSDSPNTSISTSSEIIDRSFDDIKFEMEDNAEFNRSLITPKIEELFGKRIRIRGYIYPTLKKRGLKSFVLVRDNLECCFGPGAALFDCIIVEMQPGQTAEYSIRPVAVEGTFDYQVQDIDGTIVAIYRMEGEKVE